ncbi:hypothetical protein J6524_10145 [Bradyrhizobium sp. WSM 1738]|uniref:hypothetical protein n=1 Tax=Bradyrhizobium hereditatis TaxID=2821405 RepID=UPI001CE386B2|nr:hypothetical protein [Bradyrhizobium hereditatis]MCA6115254.1 hypothetical protein [Bradyrhizobium hereditatis]
MINTIMRQDGRSLTVPTIYSRCKRRSICATGVSTHCFLTQTPTFGADRAVLLTDGVFLAPTRWRTALR